MEYDVKAPIMQCVINGLELHGDTFDYPCYFKNKEFKSLREYIQFYINLFENETIL